MKVFIFDGVKAS